MPEGRKEASKQQAAMTSKRRSSDYRRLGPAGASLVEGIFFFAEADASMFILVCSLKEVPAL